MSLFNPGKRILLIGGEGIVLYGPAKGGIEREIALSWESPDFDQHLTEVLGKQHQKSPILILFDGADQTYRKEENIPKLSVFDRRRFIQRKLEQSFLSYPVKASIEIVPTGRGVLAAKAPSAYLFVAIPETERIDRVVENILEAGNPLVGFGLLPAESQGLVTHVEDRLFGKKGDQSRWAILIGQHEMGGLRQVVVKDGNLALTRMTPVSEAGIRGPEWVEEVMREFRATLTYIARFGYKPEDGLDVVVVCADAEKHYFENKAMPVTNFQCVSVAEALSAIGMDKGDTFEDVNYADVLHAAWASKKKSLEIAVSVPSIHRITRPRRIVRLAMAALMLALLVLGGFTANDYQAYAGIKDTIEVTRLQKVRLEKDLAQVLAEAEKLPAKPAVVRAVMATKDLLDKNSVNITPTLQALYNAFNGRVRLETLSFEHRPPEALNTESTGTPAVGGLPSVSAEPPIRIAFRFKFIMDMPLEQKIKEADLLVQNLKRVFPEYRVKIKTQFGGALSRGGKFEGVAGGAADVPEKKEDSVAEFEMEGAPL